MPSRRAPSHVLAVPFREYNCLPLMGNPGMPDSATGFQLLSRPEEAGRNFVLALFRLSNSLSAGRAQNIILVEYPDPDFSPIQVHCISLKEPADLTRKDTARGEKTAPTGARMVTAGVLRKGNLVLLARRRGDQTLAGYWEFPGGKVRRGESPEMCLERELREELALKCRVGEKIAESAYVYEHGAFAIVAFEAEILGGTLELSVHDMAQWVDSADLLSYRLAPADIPIAMAVQGQGAEADERS